jgi:hypothetical protein
MKIKEKDLYYLLVNRNDKLTNFKIIKDEITSSDPEDGGAEHEAVIQDKTTLKYYELNYSDWDTDYNFEFDEETEICERCDISLNLREVFPKQKTITVYE